MSEPSPKPAEAHIAEAIANYIRECPGKTALNSFLKKKYNLCNKRRFRSFGYGTLREFMARWKIILPEPKKTVATEEQLIQAIQDSYTKRGNLNYVLSDIRTTFGHGPFGQFGFGNFKEFVTRNRERLGINDPVGINSRGSTPKGRSDHPERPERSDYPSQPERSDYPSRPERSNYPSRSERSDYRKERSDYGDRHYQKERSKHSRDRSPTRHNSSMKITGPLGTSVYQLFPMDSDFRLSEFISSKTVESSSNIKVDLRGDPVMHPTDQTIYSSERQKYSNGRLLPMYDCALSTPRYQPRSTN